MSTYRFKWRLAAVVGSLSILMAACGSSDSSSDRKNSKSIAVGVVGAFSGTALQQGVPEAIGAWAKAVNASGGVAGYDVRLIVKDIGQRTGAGRAAVEDLITKEKVVAIIDQDAGDATWIKFAETKSVPVIPATSSLANLISPAAFPLTVTPVALTYALADAAKKFGSKVALAYPSEQAGGDQAAGLLKAVGAPLGVTVPVAAKLSSSLPDYTALCQQIKKSGASSYILGFTSSVTQKITQQCVKQGLDIPQILGGSSVPPSFETDPVFNGAVAVDGVAPFFDFSLKPVKAYRAALEKYAPKLAGSERDTSWGLFAWAAGEMIIAGANHVEGALTGPSLMKGLTSLNGETLDGLVAPLTYKAGKVTSVHCWFTWKIENKKYASLNDSKPICAPDGALDALEAATAKQLG